MTATFHTAYDLKAERYYVRADYTYTSCKDADSAARDFERACEFKDNHDNEIERRREELKRLQNEIDKAKSTLYSATPRQVFLLWRRPEDTDEGILPICAFTDQSTLDAFHRRLLDDLGVVSNADSEVEYGSMPVDVFDQQPDQETFYTCRVRHDQGNTHVGAPYRPPSWIADNVETKHRFEYEYGFGNIGEALYISVDRINESPPHSANTVVGTNRALVEAMSKALVEGLNKIARND